MKLYLLSALICMAGAAAVAAPETADAPSAATERTEKLRSMLRIVHSRASDTAPEVRLSGVTFYKKHVQLKARPIREHSASTF